MSNDFPTTPKYKAKNLEKGQSKLLYSLLIGFALAFLSILLGVNFLGGQTNQTNLALAPLSVVATPTPTSTPTQTIDFWKRQALLAQANADEPALIAAWEMVLAMAPANKTIAKDLSLLYYEQGLALRQIGKIEQSLSSF